MQNTPSSRPGRISPVYMVIADISGYTRFMQEHHGNILHAEQIVGELLESVIHASSSPLVLHELTGDAVSFYVLPSADRDSTKEILGQVGRILRAFRARAQELQAADHAAPCPVCRNIGPLKLKVILHYGDAVFTTVGGFTKIAGPDIILAHRLLKNSVIENEYILVSREFYDMCEEMTWQSAIWQTEYYDGFGDVLVLVQYPGGTVPSRNSLVHRPRSLHRLESPRRLPYIQGRHKSGEHSRPQRAPVRVRRAAAQ